MRYVWGEGRVKNRNSKWPVTLLFPFPLSNILIFCLLIKEYFTIIYIPKLKT